MSKVLQNALRENSAILFTFNKLPFVIKIFVLSIFEWPLKTGFTVIPGVCDERNHSYSSVGVWRVSVSVKVIGTDITDDKTLRLI